MGWPCAAVVLNLEDAPGFAAGCRSGAGSSHVNPARPERAVCGVRQNIARRFRRRPGLGAARHRRPAPLDDGGRVQRNLCAVSFSAGSERRQPVGGVRIALPRNPRQHRRFRRVARPSRCHRHHPGCALCALRRNRRVAAHSGRRVLRGSRPAAISGFPDDDAAGQKARSGRACAPRRSVCRHRAAAAAIGGRSD